MRSPVRAAALWMLAWGATAAWADQGSGATPPPPALLARGTGEMALYLLFLLALFAAGAWVLKNGFPRFDRTPRAERRLHILETRSLGGRQFLVVAEYDGQKMLLGVCPGRIDHLCSLNQREPEFPKIEPEKPT